MTRPLADANILLANLMKIYESLQFVIKML